MTARTVVYSGHRRITQISEVMPLDEAGNYAVKDLFHLNVPRSGNIDDSALEWTGAPPSFPGEPFLHGFRDSIKYTKDLWLDPASSVEEIEKAP